MWLFTPNFTGNKLSFNIRTQPNKQDHYRRTRKTDDGWGFGLNARSVFWSGAHRDSLCVAIQCSVVSLVRLTCPTVILATEKSNILRYFCEKQNETNKKTKTKMNNTFFFFWFIGPALHTVLS